MEDIFKKILTSIFYTLIYSFLGYFLLAKINVTSDGVIMGSTILVINIVIFCTYIIIENIKKSNKK